MGDPLPRPLPPLVLREEIQTPEGPFIQEWYCPVPPESEPYQCLAEDWLLDCHDVIPVRRIYQTAPVPARGAGDISGVG